MKGMKSATEYFVPPPPGRYPSKIVEATATLSKAGASMIKITSEIRSPEQFAGLQATDYIITDGAASGGGMGKQKLRGLGIDVDATDEEIPDSVVCDRLLGTELIVEYGNEDKMSKDAKGDFTIPMTAVDVKTGKTITLQKLIVKGYYRHAVQAPGQQLPQQLPQQQALPLQQPVQQMAPQGGFPQQQWPQQQVPPQYVQGYPPQQGFAPVQQPQGFAPAQGFAPPGVNGTPPPWVTQQAQAPVATGEEAAEGGGKRKKK